MPTKVDIDQLRKEMFELLKKSDVGAWNERRKQSDSAEFPDKFQDMEFGNTQLTKANLRRLKLQNSNFNGANLNETLFCGSDLSGCTFVNAICDKTNFYQVTAHNADFRGAQMPKVFMERSKLNNANFAGADLSTADLALSDLRGANLLSCKTSKSTVFYQALYDEHTCLPIDLPDEVWKKMKYKGTVPDPYKESKKQTACDTGLVDFAGLIKHLQDNFDQERIKKALSMLKKETFQLYCEVKDDGIVGIVKSQTDHELVYCCQLGKDGIFSCCTQNLKPCGGLRGALCKHIIVLVVGLTKDGQLTPVNSAHMILSSKSEKPQLDKDLMSATFLKYKGVEAGELDWRPLETIPEDYYAF